MSSAEVRPFRRGDRDQLTALVNAHAGAVVPGMSVSASTVLSALEREPAEFIWLDLAGVDRLLDYAGLEGADPGGVDDAG